ncbi:MAG: SET domain-containing protein-lysine N-methyltransferase [Flavobacteriales bacterium]|nr:SET domain-containing protein-lysine N-methyltransferase [Flavobacteriales bacterium]
MSTKIQRRRSKIHGNGVFAKEAIRKGEEIVEYKGQLISHAEADALHYGDVMSGHTFLFTLNDDYIIDANVGGSVAKWINHSCAPNCVAFVHGTDDNDPAKDRVIIEALRDIGPGEELSYDYDIQIPGKLTKELKTIWACHCGAKNCTGSMAKSRKEEKKKEKREKKKLKEKRSKKEKKEKKGKKDKKGRKKK